MLLQRWFLEKKRKWWWCCERWRLQTVNNTSCGEIKHTSQSSPTSSDTFPPEVTSSQFRLTYLLTRPEIWTSAGLTTMTRNTLVRSEFVLRFSSLSFAYLRLFFRITIFIHTNLFFYLYSKLFKRTFKHQNYTGVGGILNGYFLRYFYLCRTSGRLGQSTVHECMLHCQRNVT